MECDPCQDTCQDIPSVNLLYSFIFYACIFFDLEECRALSLLHCFPINESSASRCTSLTPNSFWKPGLKSAKKLKQA